MPEVPSLFPQLYDWVFWVPLFFRLFLAFQLVREAKRLIKHKDGELIKPSDSAPTPAARKTLSWFMVILSALFFFGLGIQIVAVFTACAFLVRLVQTARKPDAHPAMRELLVASALIAFSLVFLGPGPFAIDLPL